MISDAIILKKEIALRDWFTRDCDKSMKIIDGLDIGWGGTQRWATANMPVSITAPHLDFCCGYGTFLAHLGWRFPDARLIGLNIDYVGPHALINSLLSEAGVDVSLVQADARQMPFTDNVFGSVSCFLGLQDIRIGFGDSGVRQALEEATRVLNAGGSLVLLDDFSFEAFDVFLAGMPLRVERRGKAKLNIRWDRATAEMAIGLYAKGYVKQRRSCDREESVGVYEEVYDRMMAEMERQLSDIGYYVPFDSVRMVISKKTGRE
ncbi:MAG: class I SAM-dependent methyltransferase [candidate division WOR-3 bacterium]|nr:MAG: class I SAM-dependent methyltransferase [candidate division WOR-3 bacterium]